jgi:hypothetical protein
MIDRYNTLIRQAEDFRRHGEDGSADAALALAVKIMMKHDIDAAVAAARARTDQREPIVIEWLPFEGIYRVVLATRFDMLVRAYTSTCRTFISIERQGKTHKLAVVGVKSEIERVQTLVTSLHLQTIGRLNLWWRSYPGRLDLTPMQGYKARRQYAASFVDGAIERVTRARGSVLSDAKPGTELVLRDRRADVDAYVDENFNLRPHRTRMDPGHVDAIHDGYRDGRQANTGETPVRTDRRTIEG